MISDRNPAKDRVAIASAATTGFSRDGGEVSPASLALDACVRVLRDTGLRAADVDGIVGSTPPAAVVQSALGIPEITLVRQPADPVREPVGRGGGRGLQRPVRRRPRVPRALPRPHVLAFGRARPVPAQQRLRGRVRATAARRRSPARWGTPRGPRATCTSSASDARGSGTSRSTTAPTRCATRARPCVTRSRWTTTSARG